MKFSCESSTKCCSNGRFDARETYNPAPLPRFLNRFLNPQPPSVPQPTGRRWHSREEKNAQHVLKKLRTINSYVAPGVLRFGASGDSTMMVKLTGRVFGVIGKHRAEVMARPNANNAGWQQH